MVQIIMEMRAMPPDDRKRKEEEECENEKVKRKRRMGREAQRKRMIMRKIIIRVRKGSVNRM